MNCPCGSGKTYGDCCGPVLAGTKRAMTAEALMRSRYTAYTKKDGSYLLRTWHQETRPEVSQLGLDDPVTWTGLEIIATESGKEGDSRGVVEFIARFVQNGRTRQLHERSRFVCQDGAWFYVDGDSPGPLSDTPAKIGRNEPCPCGSGKKFKKCCLGR